MILRMPPTLCFQVETLTPPLDGRELPPPSGDAKAIDYPPILSHFCVSWGVLYVSGL